MPLPTARAIHRGAGPPPNTIRRGERALDRHPGHPRGAPGVRRIVATGNGAAYYAAMALWIASVRAPSDRVDVVAVPAGLVAGGAFSWRPGDRLLAISTSGELRDLIEVLEAGATPP